MSNHLKTVVFKSEYDAWACFDRLPGELKKAIQESVQPPSSIFIYQEWASGRKSVRELLNDIAASNLKNAEMVLPMLRANW